MISWSAAPAAHACGREAVGKATGTVVDAAAKPPKTSGSRCSKYGAALRIAPAIVVASSWYP